MPDDVDYTTDMVINTKLIDFGKITVSPFEFDSITELKIEKALNEHTTLYVCGVSKSDKKFTPVTGKTNNLQIICKNGDQLYFSGVLQNIKVSCKADLYYLEIFAISSTKLLDVVKHKRSFQDNGQNYRLIVETVINGKNGDVTYNAVEKTVENIILQYDETDWEFCKRLASHTNDVLIPIMKNNPAFHFGVPTNGSAKLESRGYAVSKDIDSVRRMGTEDNPLPIIDAIMYTVETDALICELGEIIKFNCLDLSDDKKETELNMHVYHISISFIDSVLTVIYTLCADKGISAPKAYNRAITGLTLDGTVIEVENDNVKLHLDIDDKQDKGKAHLFAYATGYSAEDHTGWYVMPEEGDVVQLLFPVEDEKYAFATSSIRQKDTDRTSDPLVKYWRTSFGKEIKMDKKEILITAEDDGTFIRVNTESGIEIITPKPINIDSEDDIIIRCKKDMSIKAESNFDMKAKTIGIKGGGGVITMDGNITLGGGVVKEN